MAGRLCVPFPDWCGGQEHTYPSIVSSATESEPLAGPKSPCLQSYLAAAGLCSYFEEYGIWGFGLEKQFNTLSGA